MCDDSGCAIAPDDGPSLALADSESDVEGAPPLAGKDAVEAALQAAREAATKAKAMIDE